MEVSSLNSYRPTIYGLKNPAKQSARSIDRNEAKNAKESLDISDVSKTSTDTSELKSFLSGFGELGRFISSIASESDRLDQLVTQSNELLRPSQRKALDEEITNTRIQITEQIKKNMLDEKGSLKEVTNIVGRANNLLLEGKSGKDIAASLSQYRSTLGESFFKLLEKDPKKAINLLSNGLNSLGRLATEDTLSNADFSKNLKQITKDIISALKNSDGLDYKSEYWFNKESKERFNNQDHTPIISTPLSVWA